MPQKWSSPWLVDLKLMMRSVVEVNFPARVSLLSCATSSFPVNGVNVKPGYSIFVLAVGSPLDRGQTALAEGNMKTNSVTSDTADMIFIVHDHCELADALIVDRKRPVRNVLSAHPTVMQLGDCVPSSTFYMLLRRLYVVLVHAPANSARCEIQVGVSRSSA